MTGGYIIKHAIYTKMWFAPRQGQLRPEAEDVKNVGAVKASHDTILSFFGAATVRRIRESKLFMAVNDPCCCQ